MAETDGIVREFLLESFENLEQTDTDLVALETQPSDRVLLDRVFRVVHTIKGTCGFLGFSKLEALTHEGEGVLSRLRDGELHFSPEVASTVLALVDAVRQILSAIETTGSEGEAEIGYGIDLTYRGQGYTTEAVRALIAWAFDNPGCRSVIAPDTPHSNVGSNRVLEKAGMSVYEESPEALSWRIERPAGRLPWFREAV